MGTRGLVGIQKEDKIYGCYNGYDSYPSYLGQWVSNYLSKGLMANPYSSLKNKLKSIEWIDSVSGGEKNSDLDLLLSILEDGREALRYRRTISNHGRFFNDTLFCEWAYIINLDEDTLDVYSRRKAKDEPPALRIKLNGRDENTESVAKEFKKLAEEKGWWG
jgi:hypothetical protein